MRINSPDVKEGARRIISINMGLSLGEDLVILIDESTSQVAQVLADAARYCGVRSTIITVSQKDQPRFSTDHNIPLPLARAIEAAQAVVISLSDAPDGTGFRRHLLEMSRRLRTKVALMPGVTLDMIADLARIDYDLLLSYSNFLQLPLLIGRKVSVITTDKNNQSKELRFDIGGWDQPPTISSGIIHSQSFDNIPSGEVYIAPIKGTANGEIVINGSITGYVFSKDEEIKLIFKHGVLAEIIPEDHPATIFIKKTITTARAQGDREPDFLCELGIGISSVGTRLTGNTLQDEKSLGTAHIAIGLNKPFGGKVDAEHIHEDMIFKSPTITIDGKTLMRNGAFNLGMSDWHFSYRDVVYGPPYDQPELLIQVSGADAETKSENTLYRKYYDGTDAPALVRVGDNETAFLAARIYEKLSEPERGRMRIERLCKETGLAIEQVRPVLFLMRELFDLIDII